MLDFERDHWDATIAINLTAALVATKAALPGMLEHGWGGVINIASAQKSAYVAAMHGIVGQTKIVALETVTTRMVCNVI